MAASMITSTTMATVSRANPAQSTLGTPFTGIKTTSAFKTVELNTSTPNRQSVRANCMKVWPPRGLKKFETLSYLPPLSNDALAKEVDYLLRSGWVPCLEFSVEGGFIYRENHRSPGYYDGRYWTMWKLPMFGCTDSSQVVQELEECKKEYPDAFIRIIGFDNKRQVQCISFIAYKPPGN